MPMYLVETYLPRSHAPTARVMGSRARATADAMTREGISIQYVTTTFLPDDETCFHVFEAASAEVIGEACNRARLGTVRIVPAVDASRRSAHGGAGSQHRSENGESRT